MKTSVNDVIRIINEVKTNCGLLWIVRDIIQNGLFKAFDDFIKEYCKKENNSSLTYDFYKNYYKNYKKEYFTKEILDQLKKYETKTGLRAKFSPIVKIAKAASRIKISQQDIEKYDFEKSHKQDCCDQHKLINWDEVLGFLGYKEADIPASRILLPKKGDNYVSPGGYKTTYVKINVIKGK